MSLSDAQSEAQTTDPAYGEAPVEAVLPLDVEHGGIRLALPLITLTALAGGYVLSAALIVPLLHLEEAGGCLSFAGAIVFALIVALLAERVLKRVWPSGKSLTIDAQGLILRQRTGTGSGETHLEYDQHSNTLAWRFIVPRGSARVPKGWLMLGVQLTQDEAQMTLYTFMPAKVAAALPEYEMFTPLVSRAALEKGNLSIREAADQRRLLKAEDERWQHGFEVQRDDFPKLLATVSKLRSQA